jgi:hypothetical protein
MIWKFSPLWFSGIDSVLWIILMCISGFIGLYSLRIYRITGQSKYREFFDAFLLIGISFLVRAVTDIVYYDRVVQDYLFGIKGAISRSGITQTVNAITTPVVINAGYLTQIILTLAGFLLLVKVVSRDRNRLLLGSLLLASIGSLIISNIYYHAFHAILAVFAIIISMYCYRNFTQRPSINSLLVFYSFFMILISQIMFSMVFLQRNYYVAGHVFQLIGFSLLLINMVLVLRR